MESFIIEGGYPLKGSIKPQGAKNEALQILCATLLTSEPIIVNKISPEIIVMGNSINNAETKIANPSKPIKNIKEFL